MTTPTPEAFLATLAKSGLVDADVPGRAVAAVSHPATAEGLASWLIRHGHLTDWQGENLLAGRSRGYQIGRYVILRQLGSGGMGQIYLGRHTGTGELAAIKILGARYSDHKTAPQRFAREAQCIARLDHPNIVQVYDTGVEAGRPYIALEYVEGRAVDRIVQARGPLTPTIAADLAWQTAQGLAHAHQHGLIHRDIKPSNLLLGQDGVLRVLDFGLASIGGSSRLTVEANEKMLGTADYISPEQTVNSHAVDARTDLYGLGGTLYFMLAGHPPFDGTVLERIRKHRTEPPPDLAGVGSDIPAALRSIVDRLLAKDVQERFPDADAVAAELARFLAGQPPLRAEELADLTVAAHDPPGGGPILRRDETVAWTEPGDRGASGGRGGPAAAGARPGQRETGRDDTNLSTDRPTLPDEPSAPSTRSERPAPTARPLPPAAAAREPHWAGEPRLAGPPPADATVESSDERILSALEVEPTWSRGAMAIALLGVSVVAVAAATAVLWAAGWL